MVSTRLRPTTPPSADTADLMQQAAISTSNLGWLQDYQMSWQTLRSVCARLARQQEMQPRKDEEAYAKLCEMNAFALQKIQTLQQAYNVMYERHERLMQQVLSEKE